MRLPAIVLGFAGLLAAPTTAASDLKSTEFVPGHPALLMADVPAFLAYQQALREDIEAGAVGPIRPLQRRSLYAAQDRLAYLLAGVRSVEELTDDQRVSVYNAQSVVAAIVADLPGRQEICVREKPLGSHRIVVSCHTENERNAAKVRSRMLLMRLYQTAKANARAGS